MKKGLISSLIRFVSLSVLQALHFMGLFQGPGHTLEGTYTCMAKNHKMSTNMILLGE